MLMSALASVVLAEDKVDAGEMLRRVLAYYKQLQQATIELERDSEGGKYPGQYNQQLAWSRKQGFDMLVTGTGDDVPQGQRAPNYYRRGNTTWADFGNGGRMRGGVTMSTGAGADGGWDTSGDPIFNTIEHRPPARFSIDPLNDNNAKYSYGKTQQWRGERVREIRMVKPGTDAASSVSASFYVTPDMQRLVGVQYKRGDNRGWVHYKSQNLSVRADARLETEP
jgi:hypothetical protein